MKYFLLFILILLTFKPSTYAQDQTLKNNYLPPVANTPIETGKTPPPENYMFKSVKVGNIIILIDPNGKKIGVLRNVGGTVICYDMKNKIIGMIRGKGNVAVFLDPNGKQTGLVSKNGDTYIIYNQTGSKAEGRILTD